MTIDEGLLRSVDRAAKSSRRTRSELVRLALREWLAGGRQLRRAAEDRAGYERQPVEPDEFGGLIAMQVMEDEGAEGDR